MSAFNVGILGHVDSGKTTLAESISTFGSTSAFDKTAKTDLRANTVELGISAVDVDGARISLIDCPGHATLIRAVLAASTVFDAAIIVINAVRGIEVQTVEHLLLASILCPKHVGIVVNKIDLAPNNKVDILCRKLPKILEDIGISADSPIIRTSMRAPVSAESMEAAKALLIKLHYHPERQTTGNFIMSVDHCFPIKGKGVVMTGTVTDGSIKIGSMVHIPALEQTRKVKEIQCWKKSVEVTQMGERAALLFHDLSPKEIDRTVICSPNALTKTVKLFGTVKLIRQFRSQLKSRCRLQLTVGFESSTVECQFLKLYPKEDNPNEMEYELCDTLDSEKCDHVRLTLEHPVYTRLGTMYLAAKLDIQKPLECRLAFHGTVKGINETAEPEIFRRKYKQGSVERVEDDYSVICKGLFKKESDFSIFTGMIVNLSTGERGLIAGSFGKQGKCRLRIDDKLEADTIAKVQNGEEVIVTLRLKQYQNPKRLVAY
ncbi:elongation factor tu GTP binding domain-containing protein [Ditylenchus destructor]|uniref:Elongation factor tu GTP binding domain-containing protein n=1 Tax=Ditylenchus destructor TaxID=166010 RepID=A0AAD4N241_9BILA|nr:elongation factor tu GTP binding domain-containing protein [Ditylenchus destructor]